jgi:protein-L-isoaspartate(D-aspartate) O-methyltransferase
MNFQGERENLLRHLRHKGYVRTAHVEAAMLSVPRELFVPPLIRRDSYLDRPLPILGGQTISAPHMVAEMCEVAELERGMNVLEVGAGSGYNAAVMAQLVNPGFVYSTEVVPSLVQGAKKSLDLAGITNVMVTDSDGSIGWKEYAPYDRIVVTCASPGIPPPLVKQLDKGGIMIIPVGDLYLQALTIISKDSKGKVTRKKKMGCVFVPMKGKHGFH